MQPVQHSIFNQDRFFNHAPDDEKEVVTDDAAPAAASPFTKSTEAGAASGEDGRGDTDEDGEMAEVKAVATAT